MVLTPFYGSGIIYGSGQKYGGATASPTQGIPVDLRFYRTSIDSVYTFWFGFDPAFITPALFSAGFDLQLDTDPSFTSPNLVTWTQLTAITYQNGNVRKGLTVPVAARIDNIIQTWYAQVRTHTVSFISDWSTPLTWTIPQKMEQYYAESLMESLPDAHVYGKGDLLKPVNQRNSNLYVVEDMYGNQFDAAWYANYLTQTDNYVDMCVDENLEQNFGVLFNFSKPTTLQFVDYRWILMNLFLASLVGSTNEAIILTVQSFTGVPPQITNIRDEEDFFLNTIQDPPAVATVSVPVDTSYPYIESTFVLNDNTTGLHVASSSYTKDGVQGTWTLTNGSGAGRSQSHRAPEATAPIAAALSCSASATRLRRQQASEVEHADRHRRSQRTCDDRDDDERDPDVHQQLTHAASPFRVDPRGVPRPYRGARRTWPQGRHHVARPRPDVAGGPHRGPTAASGPPSRAARNATRTPPHPPSPSAPRPRAPPTCSTRRATTTSSRPCPSGTASVTRRSVGCSSRRAARCWTCAAGRALGSRRRAPSGPGGTSSPSTSPTSCSATVETRTGRGARQPRGPAPLSATAPIGWPAPFDAVVCVFGVFFAADPTAFVRVMRDQVRRGGVVAVTTWEVALRARELDLLGGGGASAPCAAPRVQPVGRPRHRGAGRGAAVRRRAARGRGRP